MMAPTYWIESVDVGSLEHRRLADGSYPSWSPDGGSIVYQGGPDRNEVWAMGADGRAPMRLATGWGPAWSSGGQIAYVDGRPGAYDIVVMDADGTDATNITNSPATDEYWPSWSPDGSLLAFDRSTGEFSSNDIVVAAPDGSGAVTLMGAPVTGGAPVWSPDGSMILGVLFEPPDGEYGLEVYDAAAWSPVVHPG